jgi:hypothetical protein
MGTKEILDDEEQQRKKFLNHLTSHIQNIHGKQHKKKWSIQY